MISAFRIGQTVLVRDKNNEALDGQRGQFLGYARAGYARIFVNNRIIVVPLENLKGW